MFELVRLGPADPRPDFDCGDPDLNEFFHRDSIDHSVQLIAVTYAVIQNTEAVAFFSLSNDAIRRDSTPNNKRRKLLARIPQTKRYPTLPAVKIGRLAVASVHSGNGIGSEIIGFLKGWFTTGNKTGCRFIIVDAYNNPRTLNFYRKNGFVPLADAKPGDTTQLMYFDLITI